MHNGFILAARGLALGMLLLLAAGCMTATRSASPDSLGPSADRRHFVDARGRPFFWLGDTAWELFHRASLAEAELYLEDRRRKGFTVIQAVILAELGGLRDPGAAGALPLIDNDPARPNPAYFRHVDAIVELAARKGLVMALLPTWGDKFNKKWGEGPEIFTPQNARAYGAFVGRRYAGKPVVWILGGDRNPETPEHVAIVRAMAEGIESAGGDPVIGYHPQGGSRSWQFFGSDGWIDFHMFQSGHGARDHPNYSMTREGRELRPVRPVLDGEPRYEDHPIDWKPDKGWFDAADVRQAAWWSMLSGAAGHTYGNHNIWQMWQPGRDPISWARTPWTQALAHPGATQMGMMRHFLEAHGFPALEPAQQVLAAQPGGAGHQAAAATADRRTILVYTPLGEPVALAPDPMRPAALRAYWFDPRSGAEIALGPVDGRAGQSFDPPGEPERGNDWVLRLAADPVR